MKKRKDWPPEELLKQLGLTRKSWSDMVRNIEDGKISRDTAIVKALMKSILGKGE